MFINTKSQLPPGTKLLAQWMGWFQGKDGRKHRAGICQSDSEQTVYEQVRAAHAAGIDGFVLDWYGGGTQPIAAASLKVANALAKFGMEFSIMLDAGEFKWTSGGAGKLPVLNEGMTYLHNRFFPLPNYSKINGKPLVWEFGWRDEGINISEFIISNPDITLAVQNVAVPRTACTFGWVDGFGSMDAPRKYMQSYLGRTDPVMIPPLFDAFDDHNPAIPAQSIWGGPARRIASGQWQMCLDEINRAYLAGRRFPYVQICTWNDYDEGTQIEPQCLALSGGKLS